tara:strand:- start:2403 stop:3128 length:726 start_codon:yes stop_codon:yes gene_type:complete
MRVAVMGYGPVGQATELMLEKAGIEVSVQDPGKEMYIANWVDIDLAFICVPSNSDGEGRLDLSYVSQAIRDVPDAAHCIIRSTIGPDQVEEFPDASVMPEFIRENHWADDINSKLTPCVIGTNREDKVDELVRHFSRHMMAPVVTDPKSAMMMKMSINTFLAMKVAFANNLWIMCKAQGMSYDHVKQLIQMDVRVGKSHWDVPGPDGKFGYSGKCFPKDTNHFASMTNSSFLDEILTYQTK